MSKVYAYRSGRAVKGVPAQAVGDELERLREAGPITPRSVVDAARDEASPLHGAFEWDDTEAADRYRLQQARVLIVSVRIVNGPVQAPVPAYVSVRTPEVGREYVPTVEALSDEQIQARVLDDIKQALESIQRRYQHFAAAAEVINRFKRGTG